MVKERKEQSRGNRIDLIYDEEQFIFYPDEKNENWLLFDKKKDKIILTIEDIKKVGFVEQVDVHNKTYFTIAYYTSAPITSDEWLDVYEYSDGKCNLVGHFESWATEHNMCSLGDGSYLIGKNADKIYSVWAQKCSKQFQRVLKSEKFDADKFPVGTVLVVDSVGCCYRFGQDYIHDTLVYGLDSETLTINTGIYSDEQKRVIPLYTDEQIQKVVDKYPGHRPFYHYPFYQYNNPEDDIVGCSTLDNEVLYSIYERENEYHKNNGYSFVDKELASFIKQIGEYPKGEN